MIAKQTTLVAAAVLALALPAAADTLYVAAPPPAAPGHPLALGADLKAHQIGDLVQISFNFATTSNNSNATTSNNAYNSSITAGTGIFNLPLARLGGALGSAEDTTMSKTQIASNTLTAEMTAIVTGVLPSGALQISGTQDIIVNGDPQKLVITGIVRPEDIDNTDTVLSSRVANVTARFDGVQTPGQKKSILQKIIGWLFG